MKNSEKWSPFIHQLAFAYTFHVFLYGSAETNIDPNLSCKPTLMISSSSTITEMRITL